MSNGNGLRHFHVSVGANFTVNASTPHVAMVLATDSLRYVNDPETIQLVNLQCTVTEEERRPDTPSGAYP